ncbi:Hcp family type VI secretion system effector [Azotobacter vinelandii]|uniref:Hcp family type VI secretion system effector n=1 Tax=Azotobacter vinelandii TaxID=354 RepID=UPI000A4D2B7E|nr:type VI secretion system tube protein Hcp [Azotobacter vinelandii]
MSTSMHLKIEGVQGESQESQHAAWLDIKSFTWGISQPGSLDSGGGGTPGRASFTDLHVVSYVESSAPTAFKKCANGTSLGTVELSCSRLSDGDKMVFMTITLTNVLVTKADIKGVDRDDEQERLLIEYAFQAPEVEFGYTPQQDDGSAGGEVTMGWNIPQNTEL